MTVSNSLLPWQQKSWDLLCNYIQQGRIPQALLITGAKGLGKHALATRFANALLCSNLQPDTTQCGKCQSCLLLQAGTHPDLTFIKPYEDKSTIAINQIRQIVTDTYLKPQFDAYRAIIISPADAMTVQAANAFLKCLEEPTERTLYILLSERPSKLPATILSRCQRLTLTLSDNINLHDWLQHEGIANNQETLRNLARGSILTLEQIKDVDLLQQRIDCFNDWLAIATYKNHPAIIAEKWQKLPKTAVLNWQLSWLADMIKSACRIHLKQLCNQDVASPIQVLSQQLNLTGLFCLYDYLLRSLRQLDTQLNYQLMLEDILVQWQELNRRH